MSRVNVLHLANGRLLHFKQLLQRRELILEVAEFQQRRRVLAVLAFRPLQLAPVTLLDSPWALALQIRRIRVIKVFVPGPVKSVDTEPLHVHRHSFSLP